MNIRLRHLAVRTRQTVEEVHFSETVTFLYGPVGTGKSTVARLIDYCFGGDLERTPAIQKEFVSVTFSVTLGEYECSIERGAEDTQAVRVTWFRHETDMGSVSAPLLPGEEPLFVGTQVFNLSDLLFHMCGAEPIKVLQRARDPDSPMIRLSFRDIWWYCYLDQTHLDSSFYRLEDPFRGRKSQDAMRFFTGLHSEKMSQLQADLYRTIAEQQGSREAAEQIRRFMTRFELGSEMDVTAQIEALEAELNVAQQHRIVLESDRQSTLHPTDALRQKLRDLSQIVSDLYEAANASRGALEEQGALRAELITAKVKAERSEQAGVVLEGVAYERCPQCGIDVQDRPNDINVCRLCGGVCSNTHAHLSVNLEVVRRELNDRIDQIGDSINRREQALRRTEREFRRASSDKRELDLRLQEELARYDSAYVESIRMVDREIATLVERRRSLSQLSEMPRAINELGEHVGALQVRIDQLRINIDTERMRLRSADENAQAIAQRFKEIMHEVGFPGVSIEDEVVLDPRNWKPVIVHGGQEWGFWDTGSGGKKTLFNVCYALALHEVSQERGMRVPSVLIIDSPTKNISEDMNPELVHSLYNKIYKIAVDKKTQFLLIDSELVEPESEIAEFSHRRLAGEPDAPSLISYYVGP